MYVPPSEYYKAEEFILNALISGTTGPNWKIIFVLDSPVTEEDYITSRYDHYEPMN